MVTVTETSKVLLLGYFTTDTIVSTLTVTISSESTSNKLPKI